MPGEGGSLASIIVKITADASEFISGLKKASDDAKQFAIAGGAIAGAGAAIGASLIAITKNAADYGDALNDLSSKTGVHVDALAAWKLEADQSGTSIEAVGAAMAKLSKNAMEAVGGNEKAAQAFAALNIPLKDSAGHLRPLNDLMLSATDSISHLADGAEKSALSQAVFGKSAAELIPLLNQGREGFDAAAESAARFGLALTTDEAKAADEFNDRLDDLGKSIEGLGVGIGQILMPPLTDLAVQLTNGIVAIKDFTVAHPQLIQFAGALAIVLTGTGGVVLGLAAVTAAAPLVTAALATMGGTVVLATGGLAALLAAAFVFRKEIAEGLLGAASTFTGALGYLVGAAESAARAFGATGFAGTLAGAKQSLLDTSQGLENMSTALMKEGMVIAETGRAHEIAEAQTRAHALALSMAAEKAAAFQKAVDSLVHSVTLEDDKGRVLVAALTELQAKHVDIRATIEKLGPQTLEYAHTLELLGAAIPPVVAQIAQATAEWKAYRDALYTIALLTEENRLHLKAYEDQGKTATPVMHLLINEYAGGILPLNGLAAAHGELNLAQHTLDTTMRAQIGTWGDFDKIVDQLKGSIVPSRESIFAMQIAIEQLQAAGIPTNLIVGQLGDSASALAKRMRELGMEIPPNITAIGDLADGVKQAKQETDQMSKAMATAMGNVTTDFAKGVTDVLFEEKKFGDAMTALAKNTAKSMTDAFLVGLFNPLTEQLSKLGKQFGDWLSGIVDQTKQATSAAASVVGGGGSGASGLGALTSGGFLGGLIGGGLSAIATIAVGARQESTLNAVEYNTRATSINLVILIDQILKPIMHDVHSMAMALPNNAAGFSRVWYGDGGQIVPGPNSVSIPSFDVGTPFVPQTGLAFVHQGERITPANQNTPGVTLHVHVQGHVIGVTDIAREVHREIIRMGSNRDILAPIYGR